MGTTNYKASGHTAHVRLHQLSLRMYEHVAERKLRKHVVCLAVRLETDRCKVTE